MSFLRREVMSALSKRGFTVVREGSAHTIVRGPDGKQFAVPRHNEIKRGTARAIAHEAGEDWKTFQREIS